VKVAKKILLPTFILLLVVVPLLLGKRARKVLSLLEQSSIYFSTTPTGNLALRINDELIVLRPDGSSKETLSFIDSGLSVHGDFDYFNNGDLLIYHSRTPSNGLRNIKRLRLPQEQNLLEDSGLYRCDFYGRNCRIFSQSLPEFPDKFALFIDRSEDTVYIADTQQSTLYKMNKDGKRLASRAWVTHFPNQIFLKDQKLYIADTNNKQIKIVSAKTKTFADEIAHHKLDITQEHRWPMHIVGTPETWWLMIASGDMSKGRIKVFNSNWESSFIPAHPSGAKLSGLAFFANQVWTTDIAQNKIYRFSLTGKQLSDIYNLEVKAAFSTLSRLKARYQFRVTYNLISYFLVAILGIFVPISLLGKKETNRPTGKPFSILEQSQLPWKICPYCEEKTTFVYKSRSKSTWENEMYCALCFVRLETYFFQRFKRRQWVVDRLFYGLFLCTFLVTVFGPRVLWNSPEFKAISLFFPVYWVLSYKFRQLVVAEAPTKEAMDFFADPPLPLDANVLPDEIIRDKDGVYWMEQPRKKRRQCLRNLKAILAFFCWLGFLVYLILRMGINTWEVYAITLPFLLPIVFVNRLFGQIARERLGLSGEDLLIDDGGGRIGKGRETQIKYSRGLLTITGCVVALGLPAKRRFHLDTIEWQVMPKVILGEEISPWQFWEQSYKDGHARAKLLRIFITMIVYYSILLPIMFYLVS